MSAAANDNGAYACIVADPPWRFDDKLGKRGASSKYQTLTAEQIKWHPEYRPLVTRPRHAVLFLWRVSAMQAQAIEVAESWGFQVHSELVWEKTTTRGNDHFGMGYIVRGAHETCLICTRGKIRPLHRGQRSRFRAPVGRHSEKPERFFEIVERLMPGPYIELFARRQRPGWVCLGKQAQQQQRRRRAG